MDLFHSLTPPPAHATPRPSIFLAGPSPRDSGVPSWRPGAIELLKQFGFDGAVYVPEFDPAMEKTGIVPEDVYDWEDRALVAADCILFWVPRAHPHMSGLTTNIEFGRFAWGCSRHCVFGAPPDAADVSYMRHHCAKLGIPVADSLAGAVHRAVVIALAMHGRPALPRQPESRL